jgi:hypothetical protein
MQAGENGRADTQSSTAARKTPFASPPGMSNPDARKKPSSPFLPNVDEQRERGHEEPRRLSKSQLAAATT